MITEIFLILLFLLLNGVFVAAELAILKLSKGQLEQNGEDRKKSTNIALQMIEKPDVFLSVAQLGISISSLSLGYMGAAFLEPAFRNLFSGQEVLYTVPVRLISFLCAFVLVVIFHVILGELIPKSIAVHKPENVVLTLARPLKFFFLVFRPFVWGFNKTAGGILRLFGMNFQTKSDGHTTEELQMILDQSKKHGTIRASEHEMIKNVFNFNQITARQVMVPRTNVKALEAEMDFEEVMEIITTEDYSRMPVYKENIDHVIGIAYTKDLLKMLKDPDKFDLKKAMRPPYFVPDSKKINELLKDMQEKHLHLSVVRDEFGGVAGIVTIEDILEELVGEIQDEYDEEPPTVEKLNDQEFVVNALSSIEDVNEYLPEPLPKSISYETIAGLANNVFDKIPDLLDKKQFDNYEILVLKKSKKSILVVKLTYLPENETNREE